MSDFLSMIQTEAKPKKPAFLFYSQPGTGKTSLAAEFPGVLFLIDPKEDGINTLKLSKQVKTDIPVAPPFEKWQDVLDFLDELIEKEHSYKCLAFDTINGFERLLHAHVCDIEFDGDWSNKGFGSYQKGYERSVSYLIEFLGKLDVLRTQGVSVIFLAHSNVKPFNDPRRDSYDRIQVNVHHKTFDELNRWCDAIGFMEYYIVIDDSGNKTKAKGGQHRQLNLTWDAAFEAKNRYGITKPVPMGKSGKEAFANLMNAIKEGSKEQSV